MKTLTSCIVGNVGPTVFQPKARTSRPLRRCFDLSPTTAFKCRTKKRAEGLFMTIFTNQLRLKLFTAVCIISVFCPSSLVVRSLSFILYHSSVVLHVSSSSLILCPPFLSFLFLHLWFFLCHMRRLSLIFLMSHP